MQRYRGHGSRGRHGRESRRPCRPAKRRAVWPTKAREQADAGACRVRGRQGRHPTRLLRLPQAWRTAIEAKDGMAENALATRLMEAETMAGDYAQHVDGCRRQWS